MSNDIAVAARLPDKIIRIGTRGSALARWQTDHVASALRAAHPHLTVDIVVISTKGDRVQNTPLPEIGGKGLFTAELESALLERRIDIAVHSLKDLPTTHTPGLTIGAIPPRADARDALVSRNRLPLRDLKRNAIVGTSSLRRTAQLRAIRPDLDLRDVRGNVDTRVKKVLDLHEYDAILLACAGLDRLGMHDVISERLDLFSMLPAPGQAALGIQCRNEPESLTLLSPLNHPETAARVTAEREFLAGLGGGCAVPVAAYAMIHGPSMRLAGRVTSPDGTKSVNIELEHVVTSPEDSVKLGREAARLAVERGASAILNREP